jgi:ribosomal protein S18 acetylase RimI-like enzyme
MTVDYGELVQRECIWVLEAEGEPVALLVLEYKPNHLLIFSIAVDPSHQQRGYGRSLMQFVEQEALRKHYARVQLYTNEHMESNIRWYQHLGYAETRREEFRGSSIVYMEKEICISA